MTFPYIQSLKILVKTIGLGVFALGILLLARCCVWFSNYLLESNRNLIIKLLLFLLFLIVLRQLLRYLRKKVQGMQEFWMRNILLSAIKMRWEWLSLRVGEELHHFYTLYRFYFLTRKQKQKIRFGEIIGVTWLCSFSYLEGGTYEIDKKIYQSTKQKKKLNRPFFSKFGKAGDYSSDDHLYYVELEGARFFLVGIRDNIGVNRTQFYLRRLRENIDLSVKEEDHFAWAMHYATQSTNIMRSLSYRLGDRTRREKNLSFEQFLLYLFN